MNGNSAILFMMEIKSRNRQIMNAFNNKMRYSCYYDHTSEHRNNHNASYIFKYDYSHFNIMLKVRRYVIDKYMIIKICYSYYIQYKCGLV